MTIILKRQSERHKGAMTSNGSHDKRWKWMDSRIMTNGPICIGCLQVLLCFNGELHILQGKCSTPHSYEATNTQNVSKPS